MERSKCPPAVRRCNRCRAAPDSVVSQLIGKVAVKTTAPPPNSSLQPTRGRSLARRFRASFCATLRVALAECEGRAPAERKNVGPTQCSGQPECPSPCQSGDGELMCRYSRLSLSSRKSHGQRVT